MSGHSDVFKGFDDPRLLAFIGKYKPPNMHSYDVDQLREIVARVEPLVFEIDDKMYRGETVPRKILNLTYLRRWYCEHLRFVADNSPQLAPGLPVTIRDEDRPTRIEKLVLHDRVLDRSFFEERPNGGNEFVFLINSDGMRQIYDGFQWWILTWKFNNDLLTLYASHWIIDRDSSMKRNTIYFTYSFKAWDTPSDALTDKVDVAKIGMKLRLSDRERLYLPPFQTNTSIKNVPDSHMRRVMNGAEIALRHDREHDEKEGWVTVKSQYGLFDVLGRLNHLVYSMDVGPLREFYLDKEFKKNWLRLFIRALYEEMYDDPDINRILTADDIGVKWTSSRIDEYGMPHDWWFMPTLNHPLDKKVFEIIKDDWVRVLKMYDEWLTKFYTVIREGSKQMTTTDYGSLPSDNT